MVGEEKNSINELKNKFYDKYSQRNDNNTFRTISDIRKNGVKEAGKTAADYAVKKSLEAGLTSVGVPPVISKFIANKSSGLVLKFGKYLFIFFLCALLGGLSLFAVLVTGGQDIKESKIAANIPKPYLEAYKDVSNVTGIPWTIFAAIGRVQTDHGRLSPYDKIIRNDKGFVDQDINTKILNLYASRIESQEDGSTYPSAISVYSNEYTVDGSVYDCSNGCGPSPSISLNNQLPQGIFLIKPNNNTEGKNLNNIEDSIDVLADMLTNYRDIILENKPFGYGEDPKTAVALWQEVILNIQDKLGNPLNISLDCKDIEVSKNIDVKIKQLWQCEIEKRKLFILDNANVNLDGTYSYSQISDDAVTSTLISEALAVSYNFSEFESSCNSKDYTSGVFPLTLEQAKKFNIDRCNEVDNILTTAKIVLDGESIPPGERVSNYLYQPLANGWSKIVGALGDLETINNFYKIGPRQETTISKNCENEIKNFVIYLISNNTSKKFIDMSLKSKNSPIYSSNCANKSKPLSNKILRDSINYQLDYYFLSGGEEFSPTEEETTKLNLVREYFNTGRVISISSRYGIDSSIKRLSVNDVEIEVPISSMLSISNNYFIDNIIKVAKSYGGLIEDDQLEYTGSSDNIGLAYLRDQTFSGKVPWVNWSSDFEKINFSKCGNPNNSSYVSRPIVVYSWERLCRDAELSNVHLTITSAYRNNEKQKEVKKERGRFAADPATPGKSLNTWVGGSPHERGLAIDIAVSKPENRNDNNYLLKSLKFLHNKVGCYDPKSNKYYPFPAELDFIDYANKRTPQCPSNQIQISRVNTYGFALFCTLDSKDTGKALESFNSFDVINCVASDKVVREDWHIQLGIPILTEGNLEENQKYIKLIKKTFPYAYWDEAINVAKSISNFDEKYFLPKKDNNPDYIGIFGIPINNQSLSIYRDNFEKNATFNNLIDFAKNPETNVKLSYLLWQQCDFGAFSPLNLLNYKEKCNKANLKSRISAPSLNDESNTFVSKLLTNLIEDNDNFEIDNMLLEIYPEKFTTINNVNNVFDKTYKIDFSQIKTGDIIFTEDSGTLLNYGVVIDPKNYIYLISDKQSGASLREFSKNTRNIFYRRLK